MGKHETTGEEYDEMRELSPQNYPYGAHLLKDEFYWDCTDDDSPFGNDTGADTFEFFQDWREEHPRASPVRFLNELLKMWEVTSDNWDVVEPDAAKQLFDEQEFSFLTRDSAVIAVAFGQIMLGEKVHPEIKRRALLAIQRQSLPGIANQMFNEKYVPVRMDRLSKMKALLSQQ